jgi:hypothetical protein
MFIQPPDDSDGEETIPADSPASAVGNGTAKQPRIKVGREHVDVVAFAREPFTEGQIPRHEASFLKAVSEQLGDCSPEDTLVRSYARAVTDPATALIKLKSPLDTTGTVQGRVVSVRADLYPLTVVPGPQPRGRTGREFRSTADPVVGTTPAGQISYTYDSPQHLRTATRDAVSRTITGAQKRGRAGEIVATGVRREITGHLAAVHFRDGSATQHILVVRDGITRWATSQMLIWDLVGKAPATAADVIVEKMLPQHLLTDTADERALSKYWMKLVGKVASEYRDGITTEGPSERSVVLRQALRLPATTYLAMEDGGDALPGAVDRIVADIHTDVESWSRDDENFHNAHGVLESMHASGELSLAEYEMCVDPCNLDNPLRRAVAISALMLGEKYELFKREVRRQGLRGAVRAQHVAELLAPVLTEPWSQVKGVGSAWGYAGALPEVESFTPAHPDDYLELVQDAVAGDVDAMSELRLAGSIALIANGIVSTTLVGGSGGAAKKTERMALDELFRGLLATEEGLTQLAVAANAFRPTEPDKRNPLPYVDMSREDRASRDGAGVPAGPGGKGRMDAGDLVGLAKEGLPDSGTKGGGDPTGGDEPLSDQEKASHDLDRNLDELPARVEGLATFLENIGALRLKSERSEALFAAEKVNDMQQQVLRAQAALLSLQFPVTS